MSFASDVKRELSEKLPNAKHCRAAELSGMLLLGASVELMPNEATKLIFLSENELLVKKCFTFIKNSYNMKAVVEELSDSDRKKDSYRLTLCGEQEINELLKSLGLKLSVEGSIVPAGLRNVLSRSCCMRSWIRSLFLMAGTMNDPAKSYHFEIAMPTEELAGLVAECMQEFGCEPKLTTRRNSHALYLKDGSQIADALKVMEAHVALMEFENERAMKEFRGSINRRVNCEVSNLHKTAAAAQKQVADIELIRDLRGFENLSEELKTVAMLRLQYPESSLKELGELMEPPLGRSGVNHRLQKLSEMAESLRGSLGSE